MSYSLKIILLKDCPKSIALNESMAEHKIKSVSIWVDHSNKHKYKTNEIETFPQIYMCDKNSKKNILFGGCDDFDNLFNDFKNNKFTNDELNKKINEYTTKHNMTKEHMLILIKLFCFPNFC
jgi:hypothetical protein